MDVWVEGVREEEQKKVGVAEMKLELRTSEARISTYSLWNVILQKFL